MSRLNGLLRKFEEGRAVDVLNGITNMNRARALTEMQARYDHLAGVPPTPREAV